MVALYKGNSIAIFVMYLLLDLSRNSLCTLRSWENELDNFTVADESCECRGAMPLGGVYTNDSNCGSLIELSAKEQKRNHYILIKISVNYY